MSNVTYQRETLAAARAAGIEALLTANWREIATYQDIVLNVDWAVYQQVEDIGQVRIFTVRKDGVLVGYAAFFVRTNLHYRDSMQAANDVIFISPEHRSGRIGVNLVRFAEAALREEGVQLIAYHAKLAHPTLGLLLQHTGYTPGETVFTKRLDK